jgi:predicted lysophospholipase L1 biosynthesis ABC-type transport system permease subunit
MARVAGGIAGVSGAALGGAAAVPVAAVGLATGQPGQKDTVQTAAAAMGYATSTVTVAAVKVGLSPVTLIEKARAANLFKQQVKIDNGQAPGYQFGNIIGGFIAKGKQQRGVSDDQPYKFGDFGTGLWHM